MKGLGGVLCLLWLSVANAAVGWPSARYVAVDSLGTFSIDVKDQRCMWRQAFHDKEVHSWEFQLVLPKDRFAKISRSQLLEQVTSVLVNTSRVCDEAKVAATSKRTSLYLQTMNMLSTPDGRSLLDPNIKYPWAEKGFLRLRAKIPSFFDRNDGLWIQRDHADLTLKLKDIDPGTFPRLQQNMSKRVKPQWPAWQKDRLNARLKVKEENDVYCREANRVSFEAKYAPVPVNTNITSLAGVGLFFPGLAKYLQMPEEMALPRASNRLFSKTVWDMKIGGVRGTTAITLLYPDEWSLSAGVNAIGGEWAFRIKRIHLKAMLGCNHPRYFHPLEVLSDLCQMLHDSGWDSSM